MASSNLITCFLLVLVLVHATNSTILTPKGDKEKEVVNVEAWDRMNLLKSNKVIGAGLDVEVSTKKLKGRKMMTKETKEQSLEVEKEGQITENDGNSPKKPYGKPVEETQKAIDSKKGSSRSTRNDSKSQQFDNSSQKLHISEDHNVKEIGNLMDEDYPGGGGPRHLPPIHH